MSCRGGRQLFGCHPAIGLKRDGRVAAQMVRRALFIEVLPVTTGETKRKPGIKNERRNQSSKKFPSCHFIIICWSILVLLFVLMLARLLKLGGGGGGRGGDVFPN